MILFLPKIQNIAKQITLDGWLIGTLRLTYTIKIRYGWVMHILQLSYAYVTAEFNYKPTLIYNLETKKLAAVSTKYKPNKTTACFFHITRAGRSLLSSSFATAVSLPWELRRLQATQWFCYLLHHQAHLPYPPSSSNKNKFKTQRKSERDWKRERWPVWWQAVVVVTTVKMETGKNGSEKQRQGRRWQV